MISIKFLGVSKSDVEKATKANLDTCKAEADKWRTRKESAGKNAREAQKELE